MFELFLNPANMILGGALISSPIIIHLINRMRFRRIRWAAMEFLLKSQKRNRRRLIIEQMILLALRILLVLLAGLLLARFLGMDVAGLFQPRNTVHVILFDDRLSMSDHWKAEDGEQKTCIHNAREVIEKDIVKNAALARTPQRIVLLLLSAPQTPAFDQRLTDDSARELGSLLKQVEGTSLHLDLLEGLKTARDIFQETSQDQRYLHIVSDFRQRHWDEAGATEAQKILEGLAGDPNKSGVGINLVDSAHPVRSENQRMPLYHDNLAIVELRPETRVAADGMPVQFTVSVANFSPSERKNIRVAIKVDGFERLDSSVQFQSVPPGIISGTFQVTFSKLGYNQVTANLENEEVGLLADNLRHAVVEVRRQVPLYLIDGDPSGGDKPGGDTFHLRTVFTSAKGYDVVRGGVRDLERPNLDQYPSIYLINVRDLSDKAVKNLEQYVQGGGSVAFFMGERVSADFYNRKLYANGKGIFPAPLADRPTPELSEEEKQARQEQNFTPQLQIFVRSENHPVLAEIYKTRGFFKFLNIDRYYPVPRQKWSPEPGTVEELITLPNRRPISDYESQAQQIINALPIDDAKYAPYRAALVKHQRAIRDSLTGKALHQLANELYSLLNDKGAPEETGPEKPADKTSLVEFWQQTEPAIRQLRARIDKFRETVQLGDPLMISGRFGKGRTVAFLTTAGQKWNDWGGGPAAPTYPILMLDLQKYLSSLGSDADKNVGAPLDIEVDAARYKPKIKVFHQPESREGDKPAQPAAPGQRPGLQDLGEESGTEMRGRLAFSFRRTEKPGLYYVELSPRTEPGAEEKTEMRAFALNVDTDHESNLLRAAKNDLERLATGIQVVSQGSGWATKLANRQSDLSESAWFYLIFLVILVAEQALAVHLSFHLRGEEGQMPAARPQAAAA